MASSSTDQVSEVFEKAKADFLNGIKDQKLRSQLQKATTVDDIWDYTEQLQKDQGSNKRLRGMKRIGPYIERLQEYAGVIEVFVQVKPDILALIWGPMKLLLQVSSNLVASFDAILGVMKNMGSILPRFNEFVPLFKNNERIRYVLGLFFQDILDFYLISLRFFGLTRSKVFFESLWPARQAEIQVIAENIEKHRLLLCNEITLNDILEAHTARKKALEHYAETRKFQERQDFHSMETCIRPPSYDEDLDRIRNTRCEGTGLWLVQGQQFVTWAEGKQKSHQVLWLQGIPGADLKRDLKGDSKFALNIFTKLLQAAGPTYITIDGLDEIDDCTQQVFLHLLLDELKSLPHTKLLISSRRVERIERILKPVATILPIDHKNSGCIEAYVSHRGGEWLDTSFFDSDARSEVRQLLNPLASKADGMFLYARIVLEDVEMLQDLDSIRDQLSVLPEGLDEAYERIPQRITKYPSAAQKQCKKILSWIACSPVQITRHEMEQALIIQANQRRVPQVRSNLNTLPLCGPLVEVEDEHLKFVHFTVKEYLLQYHKNKLLDEGEALLEISTTCLAYLCSDCLDPDLSDDDIERNVISGAYRLLNFSHHQWAECLRLCTRHFRDELPPQLVPLLGHIIQDIANPYYSQDSETNLRLWSLNRFRSNLEEAEAISRSLDFRSIMATSYDWRLDEGDTSWADFDPTTISATTIRVHQVLQSLICNGKKHEKDCHCSEIQKNYGLAVNRTSFAPGAIKSHNIPAVQWAFSSDVTERYEMSKTPFLPKVMASGSIEIFNNWRNNVLSCGYTVLRPYLVVVTRKWSPLMELQVASLWIEQHQLGNFPPNKQALVACGANVNYRPNRSSTALLPLHHAIKSISAEAADLAKYLLLSGADPHVKAIRPSGKNKGQKAIPSLEPGAKGISKWLGKTWDELVGWAADERRKALADGFSQASSSRLLAEKG
ncbi:NACHT nucleoside triphosphatase [Fusarium acutatum]|uniref:NACHT nucleoside triphosphatase n=1 Tax=Fusarium acutatum TaxID=78861 RepID=A0A8H4K4Y5_9HYPO|nr:NACHT nucleoside triphosphatase [Fusarium acutatum]